MTIRERINQDFTSSVKAREAFAVSVLRMLLASLKNAEIDKRGELDEDELLTVLKKEVKQIKDALVSFEQGGRADLVDKSKKELEILSRYMPAQMGEDDLRVIIKQTISSLGEVTASDFGRVMSEVMKVTKGQADGSAVSKIVKEELSH
ncbi:MAG: GatB/YqeY domain-containing protein [Patescibacteria group bacterium]